MPRALPSCLPSDRCLEWRCPRTIAERDSRSPPLNSLHGEPRRARTSSRRRGCISRQVSAQDIYHRRDRGACAARRGSADQHGRGAGPSRAIGQREIDFFLQTRQPVQPGRAAATGDQEAASRPVLVPSFSGEKILFRFARIRLWNCELAVPFMRVRCRQYLLPEPVEAGGTEQPEIKPEIGYFHPVGGLAGGRGRHSADRSS